MRIALDGLPLTAPKSGVGHYTYELAHALAVSLPAVSFEITYPSTYPSLTLAAAADNHELPGNLKVVRVPVGPLGRHWWSIGLPGYIRRERLDLFHGTNYDVPLRRYCATVLTIHDLSQLLHPETHPRRRVNRARRRVPLMARTADAIIVPTETVRREVLEQFKLSAANVFAIPEAARRSFRPISLSETDTVRKRLGVGENFVLAVGTLEPRKNLRVLIRAFEEVAGAVARPSGRAQWFSTQALPDGRATAPAQSLQLVIAGGAGWLSGPFFEALDSSPARSRILLTDYLQDEDLRALYSSCRAFVYPSIYEGFGLPPLEAMACGAPVIASRIPTLLETLDDAAQFFDPQSSEQLSQAIIEVTTNQDLRQRLISAGLERVSQFSWERTAQLTFEVYQVALKKFASRK
jgi:glycosyltransferase involved in cell wall biosynthesis